MAMRRVISWRRLCPGLLVLGILLARVPIVSAAALPPGTVSILLITGKNLSVIRNNFTGWVGMQFTVGQYPITVVSLGRLVAPGSTGTHVVKLVDVAEEMDIPGGATTVARRRARSWALRIRR